MSFSYCLGKMKTDTATDQNLVWMLNVCGERNIKKEYFSNRKLQYDKLFCTN